MELECNTCQYWRNPSPVPYLELEKAHGEAVYIGVWRFSPQYFDCDLFDFVENVVILVVIQLITSQ